MQQKPLLLFKNPNLFGHGLLMVFLIFSTFNIFAENTPPITSYCGNNHNSQDRVCSAYNVNSRDFVQITVASCLESSKELSFVVIVSTNALNTQSFSAIKGTLTPDAHRNLNFVPSQSTWINKILFTNDHDEAYIIDKRIM